MAPMSSDFSGATLVQTIDPHEAGTLHREKVESKYPKRVARKASFAAGAGTLIEYYELAVYGFMAITIGQLFFPSEDPVVSTLMALGVFASSYLVRPLGGFFFGHLGDKYGRKTALLGSVGLMIAAVIAMGSLPTYGSIGVAASILMLLARMTQGFAAGGEVGGAATYIAEAAPPGKRGRYGAATAMGATAGFAVASAVVGMTRMFLDQEQMLAFGWRIPFLVSVILAVIALAGRMLIDESNDFKELQKSAQKKVVKTPLLQVIKEHPVAVLRMTGMAMALNGTVYIGLTFFPIFLETHGHEPLKISWMAAFAIGLSTLCYPLIGMLSDRFGRKAVLNAGHALFLIMAVPTFYIMSTSDSLPVVFAMYLIFMTISGFTQVVTFVAGPELFPIKVRYTGVALGLNLGATIAGGTAPLVAMWLLDATGSSVAPAGWVILVSVIGVASILGLKGRHNELLANDNEDLEEQPAASRPVV